MCQGGKLCLDNGNEGLCLETESHSRRRSSVLVRPGRSQGPERRGWRFVPKDELELESSACSLRRSNYVLQGQDGQVLLRRCVQGSGCRTVGKGCVWVVEGF